MPELSRLCDVETLRYVFAVLLLVGLPPGLLFWFWIHPFPNFWRRLGPVKSYVISSAAMLGMMIGLYVLRDRMLVTEYGTHVGLMVPGFLCLAVAAWIAVRRRKLLTFRILAGVPEISADRGALLKEGPYAIIRHPRYVEVLVGMLGYALISNYLAAYVVVAASVPVVWLIVVLEERELAERFGEEYQQYRERVPMFVPRWRFR